MRGERAGMLMVLVACVASLWLAATKQLDLYVHPRYVGFTVVMSAVGLLLATAALAQGRRGSASVAHRRRAAVTGVVGLYVLASLLVARPSVLTTAASEQRGMNAGIALDTAPANPSLFEDGDQSRFGVKEWAALLAATSDPAYFDGKPVDLVGFVSPAPDDPDNTFYVSRFLVTCCIVDARPVGVPVHVPRWRDAHRDGGWVRVQGAFSGAGGRIAVQPTTVTAVPQPENPYVY